MGQIHKVRLFRPKKMRFMQTESVLQTKNWSEPAKNRFSVALPLLINTIYNASYKTIKVQPKFQMAIIYIKSNISNGTATCSYTQEVMSNGGTKWKMTLTSQV